ncbi:hypothetical protein V8G54_004718 [Vigna mungo]|uniref:Uncharacterized protein n=1 Tax=Vigna mungo TaxID=3915 RepID=A0AAQ3PGH1_VIGMU
MVKPSSLITLLKVLGFCFSYSVFIDVCECHMTLVMPRVLLRGASPPIMVPVVVFVCHFCFLRGKYAEMVELLWCSFIISSATIYSFILVMMMMMMMMIRQNLVLLLSPFLWLHA